MKWAVISEHYKTYCIVEADTAERAQLRAIMQDGSTYEHSTVVKELEQFAEEEYLKACSEMMHAMMLYKKSDEETFPEVKNQTLYQYMQKFFEINQVFSDIANAD